MINNCGHSYYKQNLITTKQHETQNINFESNFELAKRIMLRKKKLFTSYLGEVELLVKCDNNNFYCILENYININNKFLHLKVVDSKKYNLNIDLLYYVNYLKSLDSVKINYFDNKYYYYISLLIQKKIAQITNNNNKFNKIINNISQFNSKYNSDYIKILSKINNINKYKPLLSQFPTQQLKYYKKLYQEISKYNAPVDILFNKTNYFQFLFETTGLSTINNLNTIVSLYNVDNLDNAFFNGKYCVYGNGNNCFYPLTSIDVIGHELSHGLVQTVANLEYIGHSGALNESFSDIMGTMFEFYMYEKFPNLAGKTDWTIGEDLGMSNPYLRDFQNPNNARQPKKYQGIYYINPNNKNYDHGGVHINSGIINHCFYLLCQKIDKKECLKIFINCLKKLNDNKSSFIHFKNILLSISKNENIENCLNSVGLCKDVKSDWYIEKQKKICPTCNQLILK